MMVPEIKICLRCDECGTFLHYGLSHRNNVVGDDEIILEVRGHECDN